MTEDEEDTLHELLDRKWAYDLRKFGSSLKEQLNEHGQRGWELVQAELINNEWHCIFKRRVP